MNSVTYSILSSFIRKIIVRSDIRGDLALLNRNNLICVANHHESFGPMALYSTFSKMLFPWVTHEILDKEKCADYLLADFVEPELRLASPLSTIVSTLLASICVSLMQYLQAIPVYKKSKRILDTMNTSVDYLRNGKTLLIFPETDNSTEDESIRFIDPGFVKLAKWHYKQTGATVQFLPIAVNKTERCITVGEPVCFNSSSPFLREQRRIVLALETQISSMYFSCGEEVNPFSINRAVV